MPKEEKTYEPLTWEAAVDSFIVRKEPQVERNKRFGRRAWTDFWREHGDALQAERKARGKGPKYLKTDGSRPNQAEAAFRGRQILSLMQDVVEGRASLEDLKKLKNGYTVAGQIVATVLGKLIDPETFDVALFKEVMARLHGAVQQKTDLTSNGETIKFVAGIEEDDV